MKTLKYCGLVWVLAVILSGCAGMATPETNLERLAYLEISYGVILDKATLYRSEGKLSESQIESLDGAFDKYESARNLAKIAIDAADQGGFDNQAVAMTTVLTTIRTLIAESE